MTPDWDQFDTSLYTRPGQFPALFTKGCTGNCAYCSESPAFRRHRMRRPRDVISEIRHATKYASRHARNPAIYFCDSLINGDVARLCELCDLIIAENLGITWCAAARLKPEMSTSVLGKMERAGCDTIFWGFETASQTILDSMNKGVNLEAALEVLMNSHRVGIRNSLMLMAGFPSEDASNFVDTLSFVQRYSRYFHFCDPELVALLPGSAMHHAPERWGIASRHVHEWHTLDGRNTVETRALRRCIIRNVIANENLSIHEAVDQDTMYTLDLNDLPVAADIAAIMYELWKRSRLEEEMVGFLSGWKGEATDDVTAHICEGWHPSSIPEDIPLQNWFCRQKNTRESRMTIWNCVFQAIREMRYSGLSPVVSSDKS